MAYHRRFSDHPIYPVAEALIGVIAVKRIPFFFLVLIACSLSGLQVMSAHAREPVILTDEQGKYPLGPHLEYLEDPTGRLTIDDVTSYEVAARFTQSQSEIPSIGLTGSAYWIRIPLRNEAHKRTEWFLLIRKPHLDEIDLYLPDGTGQFQVYRAGDMRPYDVRNIKHRQAVFRVTMAPESQLVLYLRIQSTGFVLFDLSLWAEDAFRLYDSRDGLFLGFFMGALCIMAAYNLFLFVALKDRAYLHYVLFLICTILHLATLEYGFSYQHIWPNRMILNRIAGILFPCLAAIFALSFAALFLRTDVYAPVLHRYLRGLRWPYLFLALFSFFQLSNWMIMGLSILSLTAIAVMMISGIQALRNGYQPARYYILAWGILWLNIILQLLYILRLVNIPDYIRYAPFSTLGMVLFLSLALADRINALKKKAETAKAETDGVNRQLEKEQKQVGRSEKKYRTLFEKSHDMIFITDMDGRIADVNPAGETLLGFTRAEILGLAASEVYADPDDRNRFQALMAQKGAVNNFEVRLRRKDDEEIYALVTATLRHDEHDRMIGFQGIIHDITTLKQAESQRQRALKLQSAKEVAEAASKAKSTFLASMSHELRTPLNAILGFAQILSKSGDLPADNRGHLDIILRNGEHLLNLINQVLDISKIEAEKMTLNEACFDLKALLEGLEQMFSLRAVNKGLTLRFECSEDVPQYIRTDELKLRQVLINLFNNAVKFTDQGHIILRVENCVPQNDIHGSADWPSGILNLKFEIEDSGMGIDPGEMDKVFEAFEQTQTGKRMMEGTGIGLLISRKFVQLMRGHMRVKSTMGKGTTFFFQIPVQVADPGDVEDMSPTRRAIALEPGQPKHRMLIADDKPDNRELLVTLLDPFGFELMEAKNGREAIDIWKEWKPHLIWLDMRMPVLDGYESTKIIRESEDEDPEPAGPTRRFQTKIIAVTASSYEEERSVVLQIGCDDYLRKPFKEAAIFDLLAKHLGIRFVYEKEEDLKIEVRHRGQKAVLTKEAMASLPSECLDALKKGARGLDFMLLSNVIRQIREHDEAIADALERLANGFQYDKILDLIGD